MAETQSHSDTPLGSPTTSKLPCINPTDDHQHSSMNLMVLWVAIVVCVFFCALGLNTMLQCVFQCARRVLTEPLRRSLNSGLKKREMVALPTETYSGHHDSANSSNSNSSCAICLAEFSDGDRLRFLPNCNHRFHVDCIDKWLLSHSSCPTCRNFIKLTHHSLLHSLHVLVS